MNLAFYRLFFHVVGVLVVAFGLSNGVRNRTGRELRQPLRIRFGSLNT